MTVSPVSSAWTQFEVTDVNGTVEVAAKKNNVRLAMLSEPGSKKEASTLQGPDLREGEQTSRDESDGCKGEKNRKDAGAAPAGSGGILSSQYVRYGALGAVAGAGLFLVLDQDDAASPFRP